MATLLDRVPVDDITTRARDVQFGRTVLTIVAAVFFAVGWLVSRAWLAVCWCAVAVKAGWLEARSPVRDGGG